MGKKPKNGRVLIPSASFWAYERIKQKILENQLDSKKSLDEKAFAREFGLSRTPIREAFIMLEKDGLVSRHDGRGFYIKSFSMKEIQDIYDFRDLVELSGIPLILAKINDDKIEELSKILKQGQLLIKKGDAAEVLVKSFEFHTRLAEVSDNTMIIEALKNCYQKTILISWSVQDLSMSVRSFEEHQEILSALRTRDCQKVRRKTHGHIIKARARGLDILRNTPSRWFFSP